MAIETMTHRRDTPLDVEPVPGLSAVLTDAAEVLGRRITPPGPRSLAGVAQLLNQIWDAVVALVTEPARATDLARATALLARIRAVEAELAAARAPDGAADLRRTGEAIALLRGARSTDELLTRAAESVGAMGFDRALVSTTDGPTWNMHTMFIADDQRWAEEVVAAGREAPPTLDGQLVESDIVARARPGLVFDVQHNPRVVRPIVTMTRCSSYAVAPLIVNGAVAGLVHGDFYFQRREVDPTARAMLAVFAEGLGQAMAGTLLLDGLTAMRAGFDRILSPGPVPSTAAPALSAREIEVVDLLAAGLANRRIARELAISEATVKTHITHILRKLGAANRAEAVASWLRRPTPR
ncbi:LuxR C-terminal-related transcriptional regulator [Nocardia sp. NPDC058379]|uniref:helix-turn-helix transcriptional regulator n=1 Tax=unclassified Nocardia TaxID=2637762 RepID=UPI003654A1C5